MKLPLLAVLAAFSIAAHAQQAPEDAQYIIKSAPFGEKHVEKKRREQIAIGRRVRENLRIESTRNEIQYDKNRRQCEAALQVARLCGKFAGTFYCNEKGFQPIAPGIAATPPPMDNVSRYRMERCALDLAKPNP